VPTFDDPDSAFLERQRELLAIGAALAMAGTGHNQSARANA